MRSCGVFWVLPGPLGDRLPADVVRAARAKIQGPSGNGWIASISPASAASRSVFGAILRSCAALLRLSPPRLVSNIPSRVGEEVSSAVALLLVELNHYLPHRPPIPHRLPPIRHRPPPIPHRLPPIRHRPPPIPHRSRRRYRTAAVGGIGGAEG